MDPRGEVPPPTGGHIVRRSHRVLVMVGSALTMTLVAFLLALREAWRGAIPVAWVLLASVAFHALAVAVPLFNTRDAYQYAMQGRIAAIHGANPYVATPNDYRSDPLFPYIGPEWRAS